MKKYEWIISACLLGESCRYDGKSKPCEKAIELFRQGKALKVCPEQLGGLSTPRPPCEIVCGKVQTKDGADKTEEYRLGAQKTLAICRQFGIEKALLKQNSPSCGTKHVYDGSFSGVLKDGMGETARLLFENGIAVLSEDEL